MTWLLRRFPELYGKEKGRLGTLETVLKKRGDAAHNERYKLLARMGDVTLFMKELKQCFSIWCNRSYKRYGTLWVERFKSVLIEDTAACLRKVAAYIDLNPVRAGLVLGSKEHVNQVFQEHCDLFGKRRRDRRKPHAWLWRFRTDGYA
tara:strand:- start:28 stop:471 length:444 start_codon:yes stop_codon:yes gene_type:complete